MLSVIYAEHHKQALYAECRYAECRYAECRYAKCHYGGCRGAPRWKFTKLITSFKTTKGTITRKRLFKMW